MYQLWILFWKVFSLRFLSLLSCFYISKYFPCVKNIIRVEKYPKVVFWIRRVCFYSTRKTYIRMRNIQILLSVYFASLVIWISILFQYICFSLSEKLPIMQCTQYQYIENTDCTYYIIYYMHERYNEDLCSPKSATKRWLSCKYNYINKKSIVKTNLLKKMNFVFIYTYS